MSLFNYRNGNSSFNARNLDGYNKMIFALRVGRFIRPMPTLISSLNINSTWASDYSIMFNGKYFISLIDGEGGNDFWSNIDVNNI